MNFLKLKRSLVRVLLAVGLIVLAAVLCIAYARFIELHWLCVRHITISSPPTLRVIHISDIHFKGDTQYLEKVVHTINRTEADLVCFTGDLIEDAAFLPAALNILSKVNKPLYGIPGNHECVAQQSCGEIREKFRATGGDWIGKKTVVVPSKRIALLTTACFREQSPPEYKRILLEHFPEQVDKEQFDLILAGHTHGGQVRIPFMRPFMDIGPFDRGLFQTPCGPLHVSPGIGTYGLELRFWCRPEITVIEI